MISLGINLVMTVIGFAVSTMFIVFICTRLVCARIQLTASRRAFPTASRSDLGLLERGFHGLEQVVISAFPTRKFSDEYFSSGEDSQCTVCLGEYQEKDSLRILPYCGHTFHISCIDIWLRQHSTCPVCRISLRDSLEGKRVMQPMFSMAFRSMDCLHPYYLCTSNGYSPRAVGNQRMEPIQEDQFASELDLAESGEIVSLENNCAVKNTHLTGLKSKNSESPSSY